MTPSEIQQLWKEVTEHSSEKSTMTNGVTSNSNCVTQHNNTPLIQAPTPVSNGIPEGFMLTGESRLDVTRRLVRKVVGLEKTGLSEHLLKLTVLHDLVTFEN